MSENIGSDDKIEQIFTLFRPITANFEENMKQLEAIVQKMEEGELNLEESIEQFEAGMEISKKCSKILEEAEQKITVLIENKDGSLEEEKF